MTLQKARRKTYIESNIRTLDLDINNLDKIVSESSSSSNKNSSDDDS